MSLPSQSLRQNRNRHRAVRGFSSPLDSLTRAADRLKVHLPWIGVLLCLLIAGYVENMP